MRVARRVQNITKYTTLTFFFFLLTNLPANARKVTDILNYEIQELLRERGAGRILMIPRFSVLVTVHPPSELF